MGAPCRWQLAEKLPQKLWRPRGGGPGPENVLSRSRDAQLSWPPWLQPRQGLILLCSRALGLVDAGAGCQV